MQTKTAVALPRDIDADLDAGLKPFLDVTGRKTRRAMAPLYVRGLLGGGERKSIQPMAEGLGLPGHDQLHHFISSSAWDDAPLWRVLGEPGDRTGGGAGGGVVGGGGRADGGRHRFAQERRTLGWGGAAVLRRGGQDDELSGAGIADAGPRRGPGPGRTAVVPAGGVEQRPAALRGGGGAGRLAGGTEQAGHRLGRDRPADRRWGALRLRPGGRRLWRQPRLPTGTGQARARLGGRGRLPPAGLSDHGPTAPVADADRTPGQAPSAEPSTGLGRCAAGDAALAAHHLAERHQGPAQRPLRRPPGARRRRPTERRQHPLARRRSRALPWTGWWANGATAARRNTTAATCRGGPRCGGWPPPSRRAGPASRRISSSSKSLASPTSRADLGPACTGTP